MYLKKRGFTALFLLLRVEQMFDKKLIVDRKLNWNYKSFTAKRCFTGGMDEQKLPKQSRAA